MLGAIARLGNPPKWAASEPDFRFPSDVFSVFFEFRHIGKGAHVNEASLAFFEHGFEFDDLSVNRLPTLTPIRRPRLTPLKAQLFVELWAHLVC
jgi:hypothetical protein